MNTNILTDPQRVPSEGRPGMTFQVIEPAQRTAAKIAGFLYLLQMATGIFGFYARGQLSITADAMQTAKNIAASEQLFRIGIVSDLLTNVAVIMLVLTLYIILKPVNRNVVLLAVFWRLAENSIGAVATLNDFVGLRLLSGADYLGVLDPQQLQALARLFIGAQGDGLRIAFVFLGLGSAVFSYLWFKSRYIPRALAAWGIFSSLVLASITLATMAFPGLSALGLTYMMPMFFYEVGLGLWLLIKGIRAPI